MEEKNRMSVKEELTEYLILSPIVIAFIAIFALFDYLQNEFEIKKYMIAFNLIVLFLSPLYYLFQNLKEKLIKRSIEKKTIIKNIDLTYYRDIINEYSPAVISFLLDGTHFREDLSASCMHLLNKGYLVKNEEKIIMKTDKDCSGLPEDLQFIVNNADEILKALDSKIVQKENGESKVIKSKSSLLADEWCNIISQVALKNELVTERKGSKFPSILIILCIIESVGFLFLDEAGYAYLSGLTAFALGVLKYGAYDNNKWVKTQKGYELYTKIVGLKNYIKDFSLLSESELKTITVWDEYLIYAIIFNHRSHLTKEADDFYKEISIKLKNKYGSTFEE